MTAWSRFTARMEDAVRVAMTTQLPPVLPVGGSILWSLFGDLCAGRQHGANGPEPFPLSEIEAAGRMDGLALSAHHVATLKAMDRAWIAVASGPRLPDGVKAVPHRSTQALTPTLFDIST